jgi:glycosyltransferase involved in cell wall biosynthesis
LIDNPERIREVAEWSQRLRSHATRVVFIAHCDGTPDSVLRMIEPHLWKTICVSEKAAGTLKAFSPVVIRNSVCAPPGNGENIRARFGIPASAFVIGYVGRQDENKWGRPARNGPPILFDALQGNEHYLLLAGKDAPHPPSGLEASAKDRIRVWSESVENIGDWYHALDVFVLPSRSEGFPLSPLEALLSGTRVAMTPTSDFPSLLGGAIAFFEYGDVAGMRRAILEAPPAALGQAVITEHLSVGRMIDEYEAAFA